MTWGLQYVTSRADTRKWYSLHTTPTVVGDLVARRPCAGTDRIEGVDPRAEQTRNRLFAAILELASRRPLDQISVIEIATAARVNRSSFYQHFADREELLASALEQLETDAARAHEPVALDDLSRPPRELLRFAQHFHDYAAVYRQALGPNGSGRIAARVRARTLELVRTGIELSPSRQTHPLPLDIEAAGTAGAILGVIEAWLARDPMPGPDTAADWMWKVLGRGRER